METVDLLTGKAISISGGLVAMVGGIFAQVAQDTTAGQVGLLVGASGLIAALSGVLKGYWDDREKIRQHEYRKLQLASRLDSNTLALKQINTWIQGAHARVKDLPTPPEFGGLIPDTGDYELYGLDGSGKSKPSA